MKHVIKRISDGFECIETVHDLLICIGVSIAVFFIVTIGLALAFIWLVHLCEWVSRMLGAG
jgi:hypothetical protein